MDILDVGLTIKEFKEEWRLKYTPNDVKYWAPRLDSDIPAEKSCAEMMFEAWGREEVLKQYAKWADLRSRQSSIEKEHKERTKRKHEMYLDTRSLSDCYCYDCEPRRYRYGHEALSVRESRIKLGDFNDFELCQMTWEKYFKEMVGG